MGLKFKNDREYGRSLKFEDHQGDELLITYDPTLPKNSRMAVLISTGNSDDSETVCAALKRDQAIRLANAILKELT